LVQTVDSYPADDINGTSSTDPSRTNANPITISLVIQYSPKLNVLTPSSIDGNSGLNTLDSFGKGFGKV
jgi:hypothetical protein